MDWGSAKHLSVPHPEVISTDRLWSVINTFPTIIKSWLTIINYHEQSQIIICHTFGHSLRWYRDLPDLRTVINHHEAICGLASPPRTEPWMVHRYIHAYGISINGVPPKVDRGHVCIHLQTHMDSNKYTRKSKQYNVIYVYIYTHMSYIKHTNTHYISTYIDHTSSIVWYFMLMCL